MAFGHLKSKPQDIYRVRGLEVEPGCAALGLDSYSAEWLHECEVRELSQLEFKALSAYLSGVRHRRGDAATDKLAADVDARKEAMAKTGINSPLINMKIFDRVERERSGAVSVVSTEIEMPEQEIIPKVRQPKPRF